MENDRLETNGLVITDDDMPALFKAADGASLVAQKRYLFLVLGNLLFLVAGAVLSSIPPIPPFSKSEMALMGSISFGIGLFFTLFIHTLEYEKGWYGGRAIAESVKTIAWRYMTCAEPYHTKDCSEVADSKLVAELLTIISERKELSKFLGGKAGTDQQITEKMREARNLDMESRKRLYLKERIDNQREWYSKKAEINARRGTLWFIAILLAQMFALIFSFYIVYNPETNLNLTGVFSTLTGAFLAWLQVKRHQELAQSYGLAAHELGLISALAANVKTDEELSEFVADSESAISREHTLWSARRDSAQKQPISF